MVRDAVPRPQLQDEFEDEPAAEAGPVVHATPRIGWATQTRTAMWTLPTVQREVLELSYFARLSQTDIATRLGVSTEFVKASTASALQQIANLIMATELA